MGIISIRCWSGVHGKIMERGGLPSILLILPDGTIPAAWIGTVISSLPILAGASKQLS